MLSTLAMNSGARLDSSIHRDCSMTNTDRILTLSKLRVKLLCTLLFFVLDPITGEKGTNEYLQTMFLLVLL